MSKKFKEMGPEDLVRQPADDGELFVAGTSYEVGAFVVYNGRLYVCKQATDGTKVPTDTDYWNDMTNVSARFTSANTSLASAIDAKLPYRKVTDSATDRAVYLYTVESSSPTIAIPAVGSDVTDFEVWLDATNYATDYEATFTGATILYKDGAALTFEKNAVTVVHFTACNGVAYTAASAVFKAIA